MEDTVNDNTECLAADLHDDNETVVRVDRLVGVLAFINSQKLGQVDKRQKLVAQAQDRRVLDPFNTMLGIRLDPDKLHHRKLRDCKPITAGLNNQR